MENLVALGTILSAHGIHGEMKFRLQHNLKSPEDFRAFFIMENGLPLPYEMEDFRTFRGDIMLISIKNIENKEQTIPLNGKTIWVEESEIEEEDGWKLDIGTSVVFLNEQKVGTISDVLESGLQELLEIEFNSPKGIIRIPAEESFFTETPEDNEEGQFTVNLPEGYWDAFFEELE